ncbi:MAG: flippase [Thermoplasmata archaeon]
MEVSDNLKRFLKVAKNTTWLVTAKIASRVLTALFIILLANHLLPESFGVYNFAFSMAYLLTVIADWGFDEYTVREVSRDLEKGPEILGNIISLRLILSAFTLFAMFIMFKLFLSHINTDLSFKVLFIIGFMLVFEKISGSFTAIFQANERMELQAVAILIWRSVFLALGILAIYLDYPLYKILLLLFIPYIVNLMISCFFYFRYLNGSISIPQPSSWLSLMKTTSPFTLFIFVSMFYGHVLVLLLSVLKGDFFTGVYGASWKIIVFFGVVPYSFGRALYPVFSKLYATERKSLERFYFHSLRYLLILSLPLAIGLYVIGGDVVSLIYRNEYIATVEVFKIMIWIIPFLFMNGSLKMVIWSSDRTVESSKNLIIASIALVAMGVFLIPQYGAAGAAMSAVVAEIIHFLLNYRVVTLHLKPVPVSLLWKPYISSVVMAISLYLTKIYLDFNVLLFLPLAVLLYFLILLLIQGMNKKDIRFIKEMISFKL